jgi:3-deoxy-D-manno-octulosonate 8-phosphate phosphatase (KDO 8-P phosphatase)
VDVVVMPLDEAERARRAKRIRLMLTDVDGVLTDASVYYSVHGEELKRFSFRDGMAVELLREAEIETVFYSRELSPIVLQRSRKLKLKHLYLGVADKVADLGRVLFECGVEPHEVAYMGDDVNDLGVLSRIGEQGLTAAPGDAVNAVKDVVQTCTRLGGGAGAFREFADSILTWRREERT